jgi:hypothetical protein
MRHSKRSSKGEVIIIAFTHFLLYCMLKVLLFKITTLTCLISFLDVVLVAIISFFHFKIVLNDHVSRVTVHSTITFTESYYHYQIVYFMQV